jgi:hypothetical protein
MPGAHRVHAFRYGKRRMIGALSSDIVPQGLAQWSPFQYLEQSTYGHSGFRAPRSPERGHALRVELGPATHDSPVISFAQA